MVKRYRDVTKKYRSLRLPIDSVYHSHTIQTLFNKFIRKGKKAVARRHLITALQAFRFQHRRPRTYNALLRILRNLRIQLIVVATRQGRNFLDVPTPIRRNQRDIINLQTFYKAVRTRKERSLNEKLLQELLTLTLYKSSSTTLKQRSQYIAHLYEERV